MKITKRVREQAAMICAIAASTATDSRSVPCRPCYDAEVAEPCRPCYDAEVAEWLGIGRYRRGSTLRTSPAIRLAMAAWSVVFDRHKVWTAEVDAEAEAMLRTGWQP